MAVLALLGFPFWFSHPFYSGGQGAAAFRLVAVNLFLVLTQMFFDSGCVIGGARGDFVQAGRDGTQPEKVSINTISSSFLLYKALKPMPTRMHGPGMWAISLG